MLVDRLLRPFVADFGLAKAIEEPGLTTTGSVLGTPGLPAPEVICGQPPTFASDVYSLAATFYQLLAGRLPFAGQEPLELLVACTRQEPENLSRYRRDLPPGA
ncbi:MAG: protein kinase [Thermoanaerobaculum sp.]|nr:protein kinase [Thermoanaerobaculum sp.]